MKPTGEIREDEVFLGGDSRNRFYDSSGYGRPDGSDLHLSFVEAAHLLDRGKIELTMGYEDFVKHASKKNQLFPAIYTVYADLRERGYYIQHRPETRSIDVFPRGKTPAVAEPKETIDVTTERDSVSADDLVGRSVLGVVDDEGDVTYFEVTEWEEEGGTPPLDELLDEPIETEVVGGRLVSRLSTSNPLHSRGFYGAPDKTQGDESLTFSPVEGAYFDETGHLENTVDIGTVQDLGGEDFELKKRVYTDLRNRGLCPKTGFKFGTHFRVYNTVEDVDDLPHSEYLVHVLPDNHVFGVPEVSRAVRLAHGVRKEMVFAFASENRVRYVAVARYRP